MRLVIDSNVWISALVFGGNPRKLFETIVKNGHAIIISEELFTEIRRVLHQKFPDFVVDFEELILVLKPLSTGVRLGSLNIKICRDPADDYIIETAVIGGAEYIVSGDNDLLVIGHYENINICNVKSALGLLSS